MVVLTLRPSVRGFYLSWRLGELQSIIFFMCLEMSQEFQPLTKLRGGVGQPKKDLTRAGGGEESGSLWDDQTIVYLTCLGGSERLNHSCFTCLESL